MQLELGNKPLGIKRIRLQVGPTAEVGDPCSAPLLGGMQDGALELVEGLFVHRDDLELADLYIGESGRNLSATQPIQITLSNLSNREFSGKLKVRVTVDDRPPVDEFVDCGEGNALEPYRGMRDFTLSTTADCTGIGRHTVKVELVDNPGTANNSRQANVYSIVPEPDGFYAVSLKSEAEHNERISVPTVAYALCRDEVDEWTMEMVFRTEGPQFGTLLEAYGFKVYTTYHLVDGIPDNAIGLLIGENMQVWTPAQSVEPGVWHHLAIVVEHIERGLSGNSCDVAVYIDGQRQRLQYFGAQDAPSFGTGGMSLYLLPRIDAQIKLFRAYTLGLGPVQIKSFQYVRSASGVLPEDCVAEYTFDEGPKNKMSLSGKSKADIITSSPDRIDAAQGGIWLRVEQLIGQLDFQGLVRIEEPVNGVYTAVFRKETDPHAVKGSISTIWPEVKLTYNGLEVNGATEYDFSHDVEIVAKADLFGHKGVTQTVVLRFKEDLSHECELLALSLAKEGIMDKINGFLESHISNRQN